MTSFLLANLIAILLLTKKMAPKYSVVILGVLSTFTVLALNKNLLNINIFNNAPVEILLFYAVAMIELIKGKTKNTALIVLLSLSTILQRNDYLYLIQLILYVFLTLKEPLKNFTSKCKLLLFLLIWPISVVIHNLYPSSQMNTVLPILMSYFILLKGQENKRTSNELLFSIIISQVYFLKLSSDLIIPENYLEWILPFLTLATLIYYKLNRYTYPFIVIVPTILFPQLSIFVLSMLFFIKVISSNEVSKTIELHNISNLNVLKLVMMFVVVVATLLNFNQFSLILFIFITYFLNPQRTPMAFLCDQKEDYRHFIALTLMFFLSLGKLTL